MEVEKKRVSCVLPFHQEVLPFFKSKFFRISETLVNQKFDSPWDKCSQLSSQSGLRGRSKLVLYLQLVRNFLNLFRAPPNRYRSRS